MIPELGATSERWRNELHHHHGIPHRNAASHPLSAAVESAGLLLRQLAPMMQGCYPNSARDARDVHKRIVVLLDAIAAACSGDYSFIEDEIVLAALQRIEKKGENHD